MPQMRGPSIRAPTTGAGWPASCNVHAWNEKSASARRDADAFQTINAAAPLPGFGRDLGQLPGVVGAECVLELHHELVAGVHGVSPGASLDFEGQGVAVVVPGRLLEADETRNACDRTNVGI